MKALHTKALARTLLATVTGGLLLSGLASAQAPTKLVVWLTGDPTAATIMKTATDLYTKAHPNVTFDLQAIPWGDSHTKILTAAAARQGPDIITGGLSWGIELGNLGGMVNLTKQYPALDKLVKAEAIPGLLASVVTTDNQLYAAPFNLTVQLQFSRPDLLKAAGINGNPQTWEQLTSAIDKLQAKGKKGFMIQWGNLDWIGYFPYLYQAGGSLYDKGCTKATVNSAAGVKALTFYRDFYTKYKLPTDNSPDLGGGLDNGNYPLGTSYNTFNFDITYPKMKGKWAISPLPAGPTGKRTSFLGGTVIGIMAYSKNADAAADFLKTLYTAKVSDALVSNARKQGLYFIPPVAEFSKALGLPADQSKALIAQLKEGAGPPNCKGWEASNADMVKALQSVILNKVDPKKALDQVAAAMDANLKK
ncbi:extracellular solute-binding protein [Deinococcus marmoris]|uniref:Maltose/maltodextrin ABC transporter, substrate binding periplasmic protein MalE n=1 Tax=Deinococcus marmoris TaxID=249408 RepID=A0A1U7P018_9DEIO|nr:extracellular solute-binding protein [Deinococcus marmoris]OLV18498.1 Maltose/maltodextrin ABC transporter, substrate binding periplasmic protein MalE [Deinococcus marmoris]